MKTDYIPAQRTSRDVRSRNRSRAKFFRIRNIPDQNQGTMAESIRIDDQKPMYTGVGNLLRANYMISGNMEELTERDVFSYVDSSEFIRRFVTRVTDHVQIPKVPVYEFDTMVLAKNADDDVPEGVIWGMSEARNKHIGLTSNNGQGPEALETIQNYLQRLNFRPTRNAVTEFVQWLQDHYGDLHPLSPNAVIEIPDPKASKTGDYPTVVIIVYAKLSGEVNIVVEVMKNSSTARVANPDTVFEHVSSKVPSKDIKQYVADQYSTTVDEFRDDLIKNVVYDIEPGILQCAGYSHNKSGTIPEDASPLYAEKPASHWQKEIWKVQGMNASTGFARIWHVKSENTGIIQPSAGDFDPEEAVAMIKNELSERSSSPSTAEQTYTNDDQRESQARN